MATTTTIVASANSAVNTGAAVTANGATMVIGGAAPNTHAFLSFDTSSIPSNSYVVEAKIKVTVSAKGAGTPPDLFLWANDVIGSVVIGDYGLPQSVTPEDAILRHQISTSALPFVDSTVAVNASVEYLIPSRYVNSAVAAFEIRPASATSGSTDTITIHGPAASNAANKPTLIVVSQTEEEYTAIDNIYRPDALSDESIVAFDIEGIPGRAVKGKVLLEQNSNTLSGERAIIFGQTNNSSRAGMKRSTAGRTGAAGSIAFSVTPEGWFKILRGAMEVTSTTVDGGTDTTAFVLKVAKSKDCASFTFVTSRGLGFYQVYRGVRVTSLGFSLDDNSEIIMNADLIALQEWHYLWKDVGSELEVILGAGAAYDVVANNFWSETNALVVIDGQENHADLVSSFSMNFSQEVRETRGKNRKPFASKNSIGAFMASANVGLELKNSAIIRKALGVSDKHTGTFQATNKILSNTLKVNFCRSDIVHKLEFEFPNAIISAPSYPVGEGNVMLNCTYNALYSESDKSQVIVRITVPGDGTGAFSASTDYITVFPEPSDDCTV